MDYYRVVASEPNVSAVVSNTVSVKANLNTQNNWMTLVSNPIKNIGDFIVFSKQTSTLQWQVIGLNGKLFSQGNSNVTANVNHRQTFNTSTLANGIYVLKVTVNGEVFSQKFVKQ